jgi:hypothetical protein
MYELPARDEFGSKNLCQTPTPPRQAPIAPIIRSSSPLACHLLGQPTQKWIVETVENGSYQIERLGGLPSATAKSAIERQLSNSEGATFEPLLIVAADDEKMI